MTSFCSYLREGILKSLGIEKGKTQYAVLALNKHGIGVLHAAACQGHLNVCKFLVEELGGDVNIAGKEGYYLTLPSFHEIGGCHVYVLAV